MGKIGRSISGVVALLIALALVFGGGYYFGMINSEEAEVIEPDKAGFDLMLPGEVEKRVVTSEEVTGKLFDISQFSTYSSEYSVSKSEEYTRYFLDDIPAPGTTNTITFNCSGIVKVGYDVNDITPTVDNESQTIYLSLPAPAVWDNYVVWDSVSCDEKNNIFNPIEFEQYQALITEIEDLGLKQAEADGIYEAAEENIKVIIRHFLSGFDEYEIVFL